MKRPRIWKELWTSEDGTILAFWGVSFAALFGMVAMSFDMGRIAITQTELQSFADNVALAAAGELDGGADAITRAQAAAATMISDRKTFGSGDSLLSGPTDYALVFLSDLPASDTAPMTAVTTDPEDAVFARVIANASTVDLTFAAAFTALTGEGGPDNVVSASAVAGMTQYACDVTPLMFCLPHGGYSAEANKGAMIRLRSGGQGAAWGPGDFGFLDPSRALIDMDGPCAGLTGVNLDACLLGAVGSITQCFAQRGVDTEPGQKVGIEDAIFNVRFDIYRSIMNGNRNDPDYAPAPNVIKGIRPNGGGSCIGGNEQVANTEELPRDDCLISGTCPLGSRFGDGNWSNGRTNAYVAANYGGVDPHPGAATRYEYYLAEIAAAGGAGSSNAILTGLGLDETGRPMCSNNQVADPERRVVIAAGIDCGANPINGAEEGVPVQEFFKLFLTEPVSSDGSSPPNLDIWVEIVGTANGGGAGAGSSGLFRDIVQLYR
ncbi:MAG: Tad domain-containing protein [Rhodobacteraceae bacterium]|nr:Tad domain-containing protein [Paracoccaceae bacterium]